MQKCSLVSYDAREHLAYHVGLFQAMYWLEHTQSSNAFRNTEKSTLKRVTSIKCVQVQVMHLCCVTLEP
jgi:hypothetical protein